MNERALRSDLARALDPARLLAAGIDGTPDRWQKNALRSGDGRTLMLITRQGGKSTTTAAKALHKACYTPESLTLLVAPSLRQSGELFEKVVSLYRMNGEPLPVDKVSAQRLRLTNGSWIVALPGTEKTTRGYSAPDLVIIDEAARVEDENYYALRPTLAVSGGDLVAMTTSWGKRGWFYREWTEGENWTRFRVTAEECPRITEEFLREERRTMPRQWFRSEYFCEFGDTVDSVVATEDLDRMFDHEDVPLLFGNESAGFEGGDDIKRL